MRYCFSEIISQILPLDSNKHDDIIFKFKMISDLCFDDIKKKLSSHRFDAIF